MNGNCKINKKAKGKNDEVVDEFIGPHSFTLCSVVYEPFFVTF